MSPESVLTLIQNGLEMTLLLAAPLLLAALITGLVISIFQAATQINESTLSFIPKLLVMALVAVAAGPWMINTMVDYTRRLFEEIPWMIG
jgi:flagellar biosynthesis protein FliQ